MRKFIATIVPVFMAVAMLLLMAVPVAAVVPVSVTLVSGGTTMTAGFKDFPGYAGTWTSIDATNPANYSLGAFSAVAATVANPVIPPWVDPATDPNLGSGAVWVSTSAANFGNDTNFNGDGFRLFKTQIVIPPTATNATATISLTGDNTFELYLNNAANIIGSTAPADTVYGAAPAQPWPRVPQYPFQHVYTFPVVGQTNDVLFVVRNWDDFHHSNTNPTGLVYKLTVNYDMPDQTQPPSVPAAGPLGTAIALGAVAVLMVLMNRKPVTTRK